MLAENEVRARRQFAVVERTSPAAEHNAALLERMWEMLRGEEFRLWYEATTGESVDEWLAFAEKFTRDCADRFEWLQTNIERIVERHPWTNPEARVYWTAEVLEARSPRERRLALFRLATPRWGDPEKVMAFYRERDRLTRETGVPHEVDHIVPLVSPVVCGLHCEFNLRVVPQKENRSKGNRHI